MRNLFSQLLLLVGLTLLFSGCGSDSGGGSGFSSGDSSSYTTNPTDTTSQISDDAGENNPSGTNDRVTTKMTDVIFVDTFCSGLSYTALSVNNEVIYEGETSESGSAAVPKGTAYIQFKIGDLVLGKVDSSQVITLNELFKHSNLNDNRVLFAARLLLSIDDDHNADNGIQISAETSNSVGTFEGVEDDDGNVQNITNLNVDTETATRILTALLEHIGMDTKYVVTEEEAKIHLENSTNELEEGVYAVVIKVADHNESCPQGGIAKVHVVDFDKTDDNDTPSVYVDYFCDATTNYDEKTHFELSEGNEKCPNGGIRIHHKIYNEALRYDPNLANKTERIPVAEYDEYRCNGAEAYKYNTFIFYNKVDGNDECEYRVQKTIQTKKEDNISVVSDAKEYICADDDQYSDIKIVDLVSSSKVCLGGGIRIDFINGGNVEKSTYLCNQASERGFVEGEHTIVAVEASAEDCPNGGVEFKHSVDADNNGELETFYSEIKCNTSLNNDGGEGENEDNNENQGEVKIITTKVLLTEDMEDSSKCPYGGYRLEKKMMQGNKIIAEYNDYNCTDTTNLIKDEVTPITLNAADYKSDKNEWCPNGGFKYEHKVYFNGVLNHSYFDINCSPVTTSEENETIELEIGNKTCPYGGKIVVHKVIFNGDTGHPSNYEYNTTHCAKFDYNATTEQVTEVDRYTDAGVTCVVKLHERYLNEVHIPNLDYNTTECEGTDWNNTTDQQEVKILPFGDDRCPDGGREITHKRVKEDGTVIDDWTYTVVICDGLEYNETHEVNETKVLPVGDKKCPYGGKEILHKRYTNDTNTHVERWDFTSVHCNKFSYEESEEKNITVKQFVAGDGNTICPDGGKIILHQRFIDGVHIDYFDYNTTHCEGIDYNQTKDVPTVIAYDPDVCPFGGKIILHQRFLVDENGEATSTHIAKWDYNSTVCDGVDYNKTLDNLTEETLEIGNPICPDGGKVVKHQRYIDKNGNGEIDDEDKHIPYWDYSETICSGLDYNQTVEEQVITVWDYGESDECPDGGRFIEHRRYVDSNHDGKFTKNIDTIRVEKWDYNTTHCDGLDYNETLKHEDNETLPIGSDECPDGGTKVHTLRFIDVNDNGTYEEGEDIHVDKWDFTSVYCNGLEYNSTTEHNETIVLPYGNEICPDGGKIISVQRFKDEVHIAKWDYNITICNSLNYKEAEDRAEIYILPFGNPICPDGGKIVQHKFYLNVNGKETHIEKWDYNSTHCIGLDYNQTLEFNTTVEADPNICPDGGKVIYHSRYVDNDKNGEFNADIDLNVSKWFFTTTHCIGLDYNDTKEHNVTEILDFGDTTCPDSGLRITHIRYIDENGNNEYNEGIDKHVSKWDYVTVHCRGLDYNDTKEFNDTEILYFDDPVCPDGGVRINHIRYVDNNGNNVYDVGIDYHVKKWDFTTVTCKGLDYNETLEYNDTKHLDIGDKICPGGGKIVNHIRYVDLNGNNKFDDDDKKIDRWSYSTTTCNALDYNQTLEHNFTKILPLGDKTCPDGGEIITHIRYIDNNNNGKYDKEIDTHIEYWDYTSTHCVGLDYNNTVEINITAEASKEECPDGGVVITHQRWTLDDEGNPFEHVEKWDFTTVHCEGLDYNQTIEVNVTAEATQDDCPYGGKVITHQRWTVDENGNPLEHIEKWDFTTVHCEGGEQVEITKEIILPRGDKQCPNGGKLVEHNVTNNGVSISNYTTVHCGREGNSTNTGLDTNLTLAGYVTDVNGTPILHAKVTITIDGETFEILTGVNGVYQVYNAKLGAKVVVEADGYQIEKGVLENENGVLDFTLVASKLAYVNALDLKFFNIDREMGADKALEYADVKGWRLLTLDELQALYYSPRRFEFTEDEYYSSTKEVGTDGKIIGDEWGYTLWSLRFKDGQKWAFWFTDRKHQVFVDDPEKEPIESKEFIDLDQSANWYAANSICSSIGKRLPTVDEMKVIYFNSSYPDGIKDKDLKKGEYWTISMVAEDDNGSEYRHAKFFRVVGPYEDYYVEKYGDPELPKKVLCVTPDDNESVTVEGTVKANNKAAFAVKITFKNITYTSSGSVEAQTEFSVKTENDGTYSINLPAGRYLVIFDPAEYNDETDNNYSIKQITIDLRANTTLNMALGDPSTSNFDEEQACEDEECEVVAFKVNSAYDVDNQKWYYYIEKDEAGNVDSRYFTLKLSPLCMQQITELEGGSAVALNDLGIIDGIKADGNKISFVVNSTAGYNPDVNSPLTITTTAGTRMAVNIATPVCYFLDENHSVAGTVKDSDGNTVSGAKVTAVVIDTETGEGKNYEFITDGSGTFSSQVEIKFKNETSQGTFIASKEGYYTSEPKVVELKRDDLNQIGDLVISPKEINVTGTVTSTDGEPLEYARVVISDENGNELFNTVTDAEGHFLYETKVGEKVAIKVSKDLYKDASIVPTTVSLSVNNFSFELEQEEIVVQLNLKIVDVANDTPIAGSSFILKDIDGNPIAVNKISKDGQFTIHLRKTFGEDLKTNLEVSALGYESKTQEIVIGDENQDVTVELKGLAGAIKVYVADYDTWDKLEDASVNVYVDSEEEPRYSGLTDAKGIINFGSVPAGDYRVSVSYAGYGEFSKQITVERGATKRVYADIISNDSDSNKSKAYTIIEFETTDDIYQYNEDGDRSQSRFQINVRYSSRDHIWSYTLSKIGENGEEAPGLNFWYLGLNNKCLENLEVVSDKSIIDKDEELADDPQDILGDRSTVLKWYTEGGVDSSGVTFNFRIASDINVSVGETVTVPLVLKAGNIGSNVQEGYDLIHVPGPVCQ